MAKTIERKRKEEFELRKTNLQLIKTNKEKTIGIAGGSKQMKLIIVLFYLK